MHTVAVPESLDTEERAVVEAAASNQGIIEIVSRSSTGGPAVCAGKTELYNRDDPAFSEACLEAIPRLIEMLLIRQQERPTRFELTNFGWELSRKLTVVARQVTQALPKREPIQTEPRENDSQDTGPRDAEPPNLAPQLTVPLKQAPTGQAPAERAPAGLSPAERATAEPSLAGPSPREPSRGEPTLRLPLSGELPAANAPSLAAEAPQAPSVEAPPQTPAPLERSPTTPIGAGPPEDSAPEPSEFRPAPPVREQWRSSSEAPESLLSSLGLDDSFLPEEPSSIEETGLKQAFIEELILKIVQTSGALSGRDIANRICLPLAILEDCFVQLRRRQQITPTASAMLGDHVYELTESGRERARQAIQECAYAGPAPVPLEDYADSVQAQTIRTEKPKRAQLEQAFSDINVEPVMLAQLGPAISAGKGMFVYGPPGNGKTTIAQRITRCFGQSILVPHAIVEDGQVIKFFDAACHEMVESKAGSMLLAAEHDRRWLRIKRPTVVVGGELTMESLELKHDPVSHVSEASLQLKSNCGSLLIDDFGRQRINPTELLNRWIVPLENRIDYLSLSNGKKVEVPFEQLIIFSTNLEPHDLADDAFLRRIPFKIEVGAPSREEFVKLFGMFAKKLKVTCSEEAIETLLQKHYESCGRPLRRCQARDLLDQVAHYCEYNELPPVATEENLDHAVGVYFTAMGGGE